MTLLVLFFTFFGTRTVFIQQDAKTRWEIDHRKVMLLTGGNGNNNCQLCSYGFDHFAIELAEKVSITRPGNAPTG